MHAPDFWHRSDTGARLMRAALAPLGLAYNASVAWKAKHAQPYRAKVPVLCIGNLTAGGVGKTPIAIHIAQRLSASGNHPFFLTRGYGGSLKGPILVAPNHRARDVGDEPLLLAEAAPTVVAHSRAEGAQLAEAQSAGAIVMDDGHQNFTLAKDLSLVAVDAVQGFGNGCVLPAGPLREKVGQGLARADAVIVVGDGTVDLAGYAGPVLRARIVAAAAPHFAGARTVAFAGIGRPEKFFRSLEESGAEIVATRTFPDHHVFAAAEIARLKSLARSHGARLVTTAKDYVRLDDIEREGIEVLPVAVRFEDENMLDTLLQRVR